MPPHRFTSENQPENKGRKAVDPRLKKVSMSISVQPETKEWFLRRTGLAGGILDNYYKEHTK